MKKYNFLLKKDDESAVHQFLRSNSLLKKKKHIYIVL